LSRIETIAEGVTLYLGDCREILPTLGKVDAVISDPPYGIAFKKGTSGKGVGAGRNSEAIAGDDKPFDPALLLQWPCVLFGGNHYYARLPDGGTFHVWDKAHGTSLIDSFSDAEFVWTSWRCKSEVFRYLWKGTLQAGEKGVPKYHISQKPIEVMKWCLGFVRDAETILDPFMGSGSTGVAAVTRGFNFIGIEIDPKHFDVACGRIQAAYDAPDMLTEPPQPAKQDAFEL
jgi:site-specific DNA-methyltransferase (adenine-specific)